MTEREITEEDLLGPATARRGHFLYESGHHGDLWLDLELLCLQPARLRDSIAAIAERLRPYHVDMVCGPLNEGAFIGILVAETLHVEFCYAERHEQPQTDGLFPVAYRIPGPLRARVSGKRVAIVNDVISAGSAVRGAYFDLVACGAVPTVIAALLVLSDSASRFAEQHSISLVSLAARPHRLWMPTECPLCAAGTPLVIPEANQ